MVSLLITIYNVYIQYINFQKTLMEVLYLNLCLMCCVYIKFVAISKVANEKIVSYNCLLLMLPLILIFKQQYAIIYLAKHHELYQVILTKPKKVLYDIIKVAIVSGSLFVKTTMLVMLTISTLGLTFLDIML